MYSFEDQVIPQIGAATCCQARSKVATQRPLFSNVCVVGRQGVLGSVILLCKIEPEID